MQNLSQLLSQLEKLLRQYEFILEANRVAGVLQLLNLDKEKAYQLLLDDTWWVGQDAVAEVDLSIAGGFTANARADQDKLQTLVIELYQIMQAGGLENEHAQLVTSQYHKWLVSRM